MNDYGRFRRTTQVSGITGRFPIWRKLWCGRHRLERAGETPAPQYRGTNGQWLAPSFGASRPPGYNQSTDANCLIITLTAASGRASAPVPTFATHVTTTPRSGGQSGFA